MGIFTTYNEKCKKCGAEMLIDGGFEVNPHHCSPTKINHNQIRKNKKETMKKCILDMLKVNDNFIMISKYSVDEFINKLIERMEKENATKR